MSLASTARVLALLTLAQLFLMAPQGRAMSVQEVRHSARLTVYLAHALPVRGQRGKPGHDSLAAVTVFLSGWSGSQPEVSAISGDQELVAACTAEHLAHNRLDATIDLTIKGERPLEDGHGSLTLHLDLNGTLATGTFETAINGAAASGPVRGGIAYDVEFPSLQRAVRMWLPSESAAVRAVLLWGNGADGDSRNVPFTPYVEAFAAANHLAVVATSHFAMHIREGEGGLLLAALQSFALESGHPEIENAPILFTGHSNGGQMAYEFNAWLPSRVIAFSVSKGGVYESYDDLSPEALATPAVLSAGEADEPRRVEAIRRLFDTNRPKGAPWSLIVEQGMGHNMIESVPLYLVTFQQALEERLDPDASALHGPVKLKPVDATQAWLADNSTWKSGITAIYPVAAYPEAAKRAKQASWLIDQDAAILYRGTATYSDPLKLTLDQEHGPVYAINEPVALDCTDFGPGAWKSVKVFDGAKLLGTVDAAHPVLTIPGPHTPGAHASVLVGELPDGSLRTSLPVAWIVAPDGFPADNDPAK